MMDPQACLALILESLCDDRVDDAVMSAHDLTEWIDNGGFVPSVNPDHLTAAEQAIVVRFFVGGVISTWGIDSETGARNRLERFAMAVLETLENFRDWNADTLEELSDHADRYGLATSDEEGYFRSVIRPDE